MKKVQRKDSLRESMSFSELCMKHSDQSSRTDTALSNEEITVVVCSHTHWDREWYAPFNRFRMRLVQVVDEILELLDADPDFRVFHLDGQMAPVRDYLEIRPEARETLTRFIREDRIKVGPWYVLADEFLVSGESFFRNVALGMQEMDAMGGRTRVAYSPDCFGRPAQMPQILKGCGLDATFIWRGFSSPDPSPEAWWVAPDGSRLLAFVLPQDYGYSETMPGRGNLPPENQEKWGFKEGYGPLDQVLPKEGMVELIKRRFQLRRPLVQSDWLLLMSGVDHSRVQGQLTEALAQAQTEMPGVSLQIASWDAYFDGLEERVEDGRVKPRVIEGALRSAWHHDGGTGSWILPGCQSARMPQKQRNDRIQNLLERGAEPVCALASLMAGPDSSGFLKQAWRELLENHPHDSICGCSVDPVHRQMETRFDAAEEIALGLIDFRLNDWLMASCLRLEPEESAIIAYNPLPWARANTVEVEFIWRSDLLPRYGLTHLPNLRGVEVLDAEGNRVPVQLLGAPTKGIRERLFERDQFAPVYEWVAQRALLLLPEIPAGGYRCFRYRPIKERTASKMELYGS
jgi:hypothetical protein